jgi:hypothetical protein
MWMNTITNFPPRPYDATSPRNGPTGASYERSRPHSEKRDTGVVVDVFVTAIERMLG